MTRAVFVDAPVSDVTDACAKIGASVSAIEQLAGGGTRVVLRSIEAADDVRVHYKKKLLGDGTARVPSRLMKQ